MREVPGSNPGQAQFFSLAFSLHPSSIMSQLILLHAIVETSDTVTLNKLSLFLVSDQGEGEQFVSNSCIASKGLGARHHILYYFHYDV